MSAAPRRTRRVAAATSGRPRMQLEMAEKRTGAPPDAQPAARPNDPAADEAKDEAAPQAHERAADAAAAVTRRMAARAATVVTAVGDAADDIVDDLRPIAEHLAATTRDVAVEGARHVTPHATRRQPKPLPNLFVVHPEA